jgi:hypothetical protein
MSVELLLIPIGIAAYSAIHAYAKEARSVDLCEKCKATRAMQLPVLVEALLAMGVSITSQQEDRVHGVSPWGDLTFQKVGDLFLGRVDGNDAQASQLMLTALDAEIGKIAQLRTAELVVQRAEELGFRLIEQTDDLGTLKYVFEEI